MRRSVVLVALAATAAAAFAAVLVPKLLAREADPVVATLEGIPITRYEVERASHVAALNEKALGKVAPTGERRRAWQRSVLRLIVRRRVLRAAARARGLSPSERDVAAAVRRTQRDRFGGDVEAYYRDLAQNGLRPAEVERILSDQLVELRLFAAVTRRVTLGEPELRAYYARHRADFGVGWSRRIEYATFGARDEAFEFLARARGEGAVRRNVLATTVVRNDVAAKAWKLVARTPLRRWTRPARFPDAWYVIRPVGPMRPPGVVPYREAAPLLRERLLREKRRRVFERWVAAAIDAARVRYDPGWG